MPQAPWQEIGIPYRKRRGSKWYPSPQKVYIQWEEADNKQPTNK